MALIRFRRLLATESFRAVLILLAVLHLCFFQCLWGNRSLLESAENSPSIFPANWTGRRVLDPGATGWFSEPYFALTGYDLFREHTLPLWNPYQGYGVPLLANMQSQPFYPLTLVFAIQPKPWSYSWFALLRLYLAGICAYYFLRLFVSFIPSLTGGVMSMLAGYYILYITAPHLSVEVLLPAGLLAAESLLREQTYKRFVWFSIVIFLALVGGMPESAVLLLAAVYLYIVFRLSSDLELRPIWRRATKYVLWGAVAGVSLAAFLLLPFLEYLRRSFNGHEFTDIGFVVGLRHDSINSYLLTYLFPLLYGPAIPTKTNLDVLGLRNYVGLLGLFLMMIAALTIFGPWAKRNRRVNALTVFFLTLVLLVFAKRYGWAPINSIGRLPVLDLIYFPKYGEPILSISAAIVCAIGLEKLIRREASTYVLVTALTLSFLLVPLAALARGNLARKGLLYHTSVAFPIIALGLPACLLCFLSIALLFSPREQAFDTGRKRIDSKLAAWAFLLITAEMAFNFIVPVYFRISRPPLRSRDPYVGAPYIDFLKEKISGDYRIFAQEGILSPDWASAFKLYDIRDVDALYPRKYLPFVRNFLTVPKSVVALDAGDKFTTLAYYPLDTDLQRRLLQLSSVKYVAAISPFKSAEVPFNLVYDSKVKIFEYDDVLPRAGVFYGADIEKSDAGVLSKLRDPALDVMKTIVVAAPDVDREEMDELAKINRDAPKRVEPANITSYKSLSVDIEASPDRNATLVLNDTDYPGWKVEEDGRPAKWFTVNYMFRGVLLSPGRHTVRFVYRPLSFYLGACISLATVALVIAGWFSRAKHAAGQLERAPAHAISEE